MLKHPVSLYTLLKTVIFSRYYAKPLIKIQKVQNLTVALKFITEVEKIPLGTISKYTVAPLRFSLLGNSPIFAMRGGEGSGVGEKKLS